MAVILLGAVFYFIKPWWLALLLYILLPCALLLALMAYFAEDIPLEKVTRFPVQEAQASFRRIASLNGVESDIQDA